MMVASIPDGSSEVASFGFFFQHFHDILELSEI
jgi:hypothetical protein